MVRGTAGNTTDQNLCLPCSGGGGSDAYIGQIENQFLATPPSLSFFFKAGPVIMSIEEKMEADARSIYVGNVCIGALIGVVGRLLFGELVNRSLKEYFKDR